MTERRPMNESTDPPFEILVSPWVPPGEIWIVRDSGPLTLEELLSEEGGLTLRLERHLIVVGKMKGIAHE